MKTDTKLEGSIVQLQRRSFLAGPAVSAIGVGSLFVSGALSVSSVSAATAQEEQDVSIMQGALGLEHEGIAAYRLAGASGLLSPGTLKVALVFMGHHQQHRDSLSNLIIKAGGKPVEPKSDAEYTKSLHLADLKSEGDVVVLATRLELGATNAYAGQVAALQNRRLTSLFTQLSCDEAVHWAVLNNALGQPVPTRAYLFG